MAKVSLNRIQDFLKGKRIAMIGVSRDPKSYSRQLYKELLALGYEVIPVNPHADEIDGVPALASLSQAKAKPDRAIILLPESLTEQAVIDCADQGIQDIWLHRHVAGGVSDTRAIFRAEERGLNLITGFCMFMFLPKTGAIHRFHGLIMKLLGIYPKNEPV
jgi:predicted CoA-binding protein